LNKYGNFPISVPLLPLPNHQPLVDPVPITADEPTVHTLEHRRRDAGRARGIDYVMRKRGMRAHPAHVGVVLQKDERKCRDQHDPDRARVAIMQSSSIPTDAIAPSIKVLLVEDSKILLERLTEAIQQIDDVDLIGTADTEAAAVEHVRREAVDVVILDLHLKQGTGFGVMRALASTQRKPQVVVLTNYDLPEYKKAAFALGATHFLDKARDYGRLPQVLHDISEAHHVTH
jgi:two-component system OmpR family response regulator